jgi:trans-2,3-dihydro-3-hydroxyanthranilate isomerase
MPRTFLQYDVFTGEPLTGNQLAVFPDGRGLSAGRMQSIAREMNFSETTFILPPEEPGTDVRMRIFTPGVELPMAGHPTVGSTFALADSGTIEAGTGRFVFGLGVGPTPVDLEWQDGRLRFAWMTQRNPVFDPVLEDRATAAAALGLGVDDLSPQLPVQGVSCGVPYVVVPLRDRATVDRAAMDLSAMRRLFAATGIDHGVFLFAIDAEGSAPMVYSRMFAPHAGVPEDPATGSAAGPLGGYLVRHGVVAGPAAREIVSLQGVKMQRPSRIHIAIEGDATTITRVRVGGEAVLVARGELLIE